MLGSLVGRLSYSMTRFFSGNGFELPFAPNHKSEAELPSELSEPLTEYRDGMTEYIREQIAVLSNPYDFVPMPVAKRPPKIYPPPPTTRTLATSTKRLELSTIRTSKRKAADEQDEIFECVPSKRPRLAYNGVTPAFCQKQQKVFQRANRSAASKKRNIARPRHRTVYSLDVDMTDILKSGTELEQTTAPFGAHLDRDVPPSHVGAITGNQPTIVPESVKLPDGTPLEIEPILLGCNVGSKVLHSPTRMCSATQLPSSALNAQKATSGQKSAISGRSPSDPLSPSHAYMDPSSIGRVHSSEHSPLHQIVHQGAETANYGNSPRLQNCSTKHVATGGTAQHHNTYHNSSSEDESFHSSSSSGRRSYATPPSTPPQSERGDEVTPPPIAPKPKPTRKNHRVPKMPNMLEVDTGGHWQIPLGDGFLRRSKRINPAMQSDLQKPGYMTRRKAKLLQRARIEVSLAKGMRHPKAAASGI
ncbi:hypothetical protein BU16DRAFT_566206 [Lophium mytilinum]|uniref:Uncharacterized protein n=1 Tax=Lophium mytilinum TaxID=390894 RepID=A0A6A6QDJ8_9PEZI|nr:hypothetical protein BU16DRAFT_566206 [Lophium mytilinum]